MHTKNKMHLKHTVMYKVVIKIVQPKAKLEQLNNFL